MIYVCPLSAVEDVIDRSGPSHMISLLDPETMIETPYGIAQDKHLQVSVNDIAHHDHSLVPPGREHVENILNFIDGWTPDDPILIHCWAGISRSTATALITLCKFNAEASEFALAQMLRDAAPHAHPNRLLIKHADDLMGREGRLVQAVEEMGPGEMSWEGQTFAVPIFPDLA